MTPIISAQALLLVYSSLYDYSNSVKSDYVSVDSDTCALGSLARMHNGAFVDRKGIDNVWCAFIAEKIFESGNKQGIDPRTTCVVIDAVAAVKHVHAGHSYNISEVIRK